MEQTESKKQKDYQKTFLPCNEFLLCRKIDEEMKIGSIHIPNNDKFLKQAEVLAVAPKLIPYSNEFNVGDRIIYPLGVREMDIIIDDVPLIMLKKSDVATIIRK